METKIYFSKNANNKVLAWYGIVEPDGTIKIYTGIYGNLREIVNSNVVPKSNRTKYQQAVLELKAKEKKKIDAGYKTTEMLDLPDVDVTKISNKLSVNKTDANNILKPMKAQQFKAGKVKYPVIAQPKLNGYRAVAMLVNDVGTNLFAKGSNTKLLTKNGHEFIMPDISKSFDNIFQIDNSITFDGELYVHNEKISQLKRRIQMRKNGSSTISKNSLPTDAVSFAVFDLSIPEVNQIDRLSLKDKLLLQCKEIYYNEDTNEYVISDFKNIKYTNIINVRATIILSDAEAYKLRDAAIKSGFEGIVLREIEAEYMFGGRRSNMVKLKDTMSSEFEILDVILKNEDNIRSYVGFKLRNDINDLQFEVTAMGNEEERQEYINNPDKLIGKKITLKFGERTITGKPFHIKDMNIREVWDLDVNDLNIEI